MFSIAFVEGYLIWAKGQGTPGPEDWDPVHAFFKQHGVHASGWFAVLRRGTITPTQRAQAIEIMTVARCKYAAITDAPEARGSLTAMDWAARKGGAEQVTGSFAAPQIDAALAFIGATPRKAILLGQMRELIRDVNADPEGRVLPHLL